MITSSSTLAAGLLLGAALLQPLPALAGSPAAKEANQELQWGLDAARQGYWLEALRRFERANRLVPDQPHVLNNIAVACEAAGRYESALLNYQIALELAPHDQVLRRNFIQFKEFYDTHVAPPPPGGKPAEEEPASQGGTTDDPQDGR